MARGIPDLIIRGGTLLSMVEGESPVEDAAVHVREGRITSILSGVDTAQRRSNHTQIIDADGGIIMPGLVNAHTHAAMSLFRGFADDLPLKKWLSERIFPAEAEYLNPETVFWGALLAFVEMAASGTTCVSDGYFFQDETLRAAHKVGIRALVAQGVIDFPAPGVKDPKDNIEVARRFIKRWQDFSELILPGIFCHSPVTCSEVTLVKAWEVSQEFHLPLQIHLSETSEEVGEIVKRTGKRPVEYLDQLGVLGPGLIAAHGVHLEDEEIDRLRETDVKVVHVPESNMKLASGVARVQQMVKRGLVVGLGTDGCSSNNDLDLFLEMDTAAKLSKVFNHDPLSLDAKTVLKMATSWGARALGLEDEVGTIEVGKRADMIVVDIGEPHLCPLYDPYSALVYSASGADVKDVVVGGKILMRDRKFMSLDVREAMERVRRIAEGIAI